MGILDILLICTSLSMDNMAVAIVHSCKGKQSPLGLNLKVALIFCLTGIACLLLGWYGGIHLEQYISFWDHWVSFFILFYIGGKMILNSLRQKEPFGCCDELIKTKVLFILALATNIDVFAIGLTLAFYKVSLILVMAILSVCILSFTLAGFFIGKKMGFLFGKKAELFGGFVLMAIGLKVLIQGLLAV